MFVTHLEITAGVIADGKHREKGEVLRIPEDISLPSARSILNSGRGAPIFKRATETATKRAAKETRTVVKKAVTKRAKKTTKKKG